MQQRMAKRGIPVTYTQVKRKYQVRVQMSSQISPGEGISHMTPANLSLRVTWGTLTITPNESQSPGKKSGNVHYEISVLKEVSQAFCVVLSFYRLE